MKRKISQKAIRRKKRKELQKEHLYIGDFQYRGYFFSDLLDLSFEEILFLVPSRCRRSLKRGFKSDRKKIFDLLNENPISYFEEKEIKTHIRDLPILPSFVGKECSFIMEEILKKFKFHKI